jgi:NADH-quinone oxidoreductase subunit N
MRARASLDADAGGWWLLAIIGVLNSAVSLFYYAKIVKAMYLERPTEDREVEIPAAYTGLLAGLAAAVVVLGVYWSPLSEAAERAMRMAGG